MNFWQDYPVLAWITTGIWLAVWVGLLIGRAWMSFIGVTMMTGSLAIVMTEAWFVDILNPLWFWGIIGSFLAGAVVFRVGAHRELMS